MTLPRRLLLLVVAALMALMLTAGPAFAVPGKGQGIAWGGGTGGGDVGHLDRGNHYAYGGGTFNNPHVSGCGGACE